MGQHVGVYHIRLGGTHDRPAEPGRIAVSHKPDTTAGIGHGMRQQKPVPDQVAFTPTTLTRIRLDMLLQLGNKANVDRILKSSRTSPRTATW